MGANSNYRFNCFVDKENYVKFLKLQKYYSKLFNKKVSLTEVFIIALQREADINKSNISTITLDYDI